jgi:predicted short-subunit dehydrogenase-like oxidoreductase (DUF2520 family)
MQSVVCLGAGRLARQLIPQLDKVGIRVVQVYNRTLAGATNLAAGLTNAEATDQIGSIRTDADLYIIAVADDAISEVAGALRDTHPINGVVVHTSGSRGVDILPFPRRGAFYPLQTFSDSHIVNFENVPVLVTAEHDEVRSLLWSVAQHISSAVFDITDAQKPALHLAAVFANNFTNHLLTLAEEICLDYGVSFDILKPLIEETATKAIVAGPSVSQTGPAIRGDQRTIEKHLDMLKADENLARIYLMLTDSIRQWPEGSDNDKLTG